MVVGAEVVGLTLVLVYRDRAGRAAQEAMKEVFQRYGDENEPALTFSLNRAQQKVRFTCKV